jgi:hypothetical protein
MLKILFRFIRFKQAYFQENFTTDQTIQISSGSEEKEYFAVGCSAMVTTSLLSNNNA